MRSECAERIADWTLSELGYDNIEDVDDDDDDDGQLDSREEEEELAVWRCE